MEAKERIVVNAVVPLDYTYNYRVGPYLERHIQELGGKKIMGVKCEGCGKVVVPPRKICGECNRVMDEWVEVGPEGTVENYTVGHVKLNKGLAERADPPVMLALIKLDGAASLLAGEVRGIAPDELRNGLRVKAVFADPAENSLSDLDHFEPTG
jgi:uncharacterized OB-fold protein